MTTSHMAHLATRCVWLRHFFVVSSNLADDVVEGVVDIDARLGRRLDKRAVECAC